jgi:GT2 family glycosyltransferase
MTESGISIIIVNYKTPDLVIRCLESIFENPPSLRFEIVIVDNGSQDGSFEKISQDFPSVKWFQNERNVGFGRANNLGISISTGKYVLLLNSDMIVTPRTIESCLNEIENKPEVGVLSCKLVNEDGSFQKSTYSVASFRKLLDQNLFINKLWPMGKEPVEAVQGSFMLIPRKVLDEVGGFDPDFFLYSEEIELCHRIAKAGYSIHYFDNVSAIHKHGGSITNNSWGLKQRYLSNALLYFKVRGVFGYLLYHCLFLLNTITNFFAKWLLDKNYRKGYGQIQKAYFINFTHYLKIPFLYGRKPGNGKRILRAS